MSSFFFVAVLDFLFPRLQPKLLNIQSVCYSCHTQVDFSLAPQIVALNASKYLWQK